MVIWRFALVIRRHWNLFCKNTFGELQMHLQSKNQYSLLNSTE